MYSTTKVLLSFLILEAATFPITDFATDVSEGNLLSWKLQFRGNGNPLQSVGTAGGRKVLGGVESRGFTRGLEKGLQRNSKFGNHV